MAKLLIPRANVQELAMFQKFGISLIPEMTVEEFESAAASYLDSHNVLNLATCRNSRPRCTTLEYFNDGLTVYVMSEGGGKIANLRANPLVSYTVNDPYRPEEDYFSAAGIQVWGTADLFKKNEDPERAGRIMVFFRNREAVTAQGLGAAISAVNFNIMTITARKIRYLDLRRGFRNVVWEA